MEATRTPSAPPSSPAGRRGCGSIVIGVVLMVAGVPMLICPGPGMASIIAGLGMIAAGLGVRRRGSA